MGRVAKYKKVKAFDRKHSGGEYVWGENDGRPKKKKRSKTAEKLKQIKLKRRRDGDIDPFNCGVGGYDLPPQEKDDFDLSDMKVKRVKKYSELTEGYTHIKRKRMRSNVIVRIYAYTYHT